MSAHRKSNPRNRLGLLLGGSSLLAICTLTIATPAFAQSEPATSQDDGAQPVSNSTDNPTSVPGQENVDSDGATTEDGAIVVTGIRRSLQNAQNIKRRADTVVDAITAEDIGALPDRSVTEALQRVPGVSINRFAGSNDPDHFSGEGSGVAVRGLTYVRSEFNGRDTFSPGVGGQAINFQDVPADMLGSVQVWKNTTAEMIEGGLSGGVNMNLRLPFDNRGFFGGFSVEAVTTDMRKKWSPVITGVVSNNWDTDVGRFGILGGISYSKLYTRNDNIRVANFQTRDGLYTIGANTTDVLTCRTPLPGSTDVTGTPTPTDAYFFPGGEDPAGAFPNPGATNGGACFGPASGGADGQADFLPLAYAPVGGQFARQDYNRTRRGYAASAQWESVDQKALVTAQFLRSHATQKWGENTFEAGGDLSEYNTFPAGCRPNTNGPIQGAPPNQGRTPQAECFLNAQGQIVGASGTNYQGYANGQVFENYQYDDNGVFENGFITLPQGGWRGAPTGFGGVVGDTVAAGGIQHTLSRRQVHDSNVVNDFGLNAKFTPNDRWAFNVDAQHVRAKHYNLDVTVTGSTFADQELDLTGKYPQITPHKPVNLGLTWAAPTPELLAETDEEYFGDPRHTFWRSAMDHFENSKGKEWAFRGDAQYNFLDSTPFLRHAKFGARYSDRDQAFKYTTYNWGSLSEVWSGDAVHMDEVNGGNVEQYKFGNFFMGDSNAPPVANYYSGDLIKDYDKSVAFFREIQAAGLANGNSDQSWNPLSERPGVIAGTRFLPGDIQDVSETNKAAYAMLSFGRDDPLFGNITLDGNIGVRYVHTKLRSAGATGAPSQVALGLQNPYEVRCAVQAPPVALPPGVPPGSIGSSRPGGICNLGPERYNQLRAFASGEVGPVEFTNSYDHFLPSLNLKFGLAQDLILRFAAGRNLARPSLNDVRTFETYGISPDGAELTTTTGFPSLKPAISDNFDANLEWYFGGSGVGSLTFALFAKNIHDFFFREQFNTEYTFNDVTVPTRLIRPSNYKGTGKIRGLEIAYQQTYDFLPGLLSGFGLSANYSYIDSKGLQDVQLGLGSRSPIGTPQDLPLEQLSKHNVNINPFYEKGPISLRLAYNWRSKFLLTAQDVIFPYYPIYNDKTGRLDATFFYKLSDKYKVGVQGVNLTNEVTKTLQQFTTSGLLGPRSYFMEGRRFHFILRGNF